MDRGAWQVIVHGIANSQTWLSDFHFLGGGPRWRLVPYPWMQWAGASLTVLSSYTGRYTDRSQATGVECKLEPRTVPPTNSSIGSHKVHWPSDLPCPAHNCSLSNYLTENTVEMPLPFTIAHTSCSLRGSEPFPRVPSASLGNILSRFQARFSNQAEKETDRFYSRPHFYTVVVQSLSRIWLFVTPTDCSLSGSSVHGISQARTLEGVAISFSRESSRPRDRTHVPCIGRGILYRWATKEALASTLPNV